MPWMRGPSPIRRTVSYLKAGKLILKENVRVFAIHFNIDQKSSVGAYNFVFWHLPQLQYKNPDVQVLVFKNMTPSPFMRVIFDNRKHLISQLDHQTKADIFDHVRSVYCKSDAQLATEALAQQKTSNPADFGDRCTRHCMCEVPGQTPCTLYVIPVKEQRGKYKKLLQQDDGS